ncbi:MAG: hypoxanthine-guanine phosphoribosyltransferase [Gammaproteobacteria bacterium]|nr:hypoxanthine-guanine phosphoribosyltransferase [Gammaproteobacteria bacterium]
MPVSKEQAENVLKRAEVLFDDSAVQAAIDAMAEEIEKELGDKNPLVICVLTGGIIITSELLKRLHFPLEIDYLHATRYGDKTVGETLHWYVKPRKALKDRHILIVDDILDMGHTLAQVVDYCNKQGSAKTYTAVLTDKQHDTPKGFEKADFTGLKLPDRYVFGYGMDYKGYWRNLNGIYAADKDDE